jgi:hypothetical protein
MNFLNDFADTYNISKETSQSKPATSNNFDITMFCNRLLGFMIIMGYYDSDTRGSDYKKLIISTKSTVLSCYGINIKTYADCDISLIGEIINIWIPDNLDKLNDIEYENIKKMVFNTIQECFI